MQLFNLCGRAYKRKRSEHCPDIVVRRKRAVGVDGGEEKRLGDSCGASFLNEGSDQYRPSRGSCISVEITKGKVRKIYSSTKEEMISWTVCGVQSHIITQL